MQASFFNDTATTEIYTLSLHDALPISSCRISLMMTWRGLVTYNYVKVWPSYHIRSSIRIIGIIIITTGSGYHHIQLSDIPTKMRDLSVMQIAHIIILLLATIILRINCLNCTPYEEKKKSASNENITHRMCSVIINYKWIECDSCQIIIGQEVVLLSFTRNTPNSVS